MRPSRLIPLVLSLGSFIPGCRQAEDSGGGGGEENLEDIRPFAEDWQTQETLQLPFDADGGYAISTLRIGGLGGDNFFNRGDVVVLYDAKPGEMEIEARRFAHAAGKDAAQEVFDRLVLWLSDSSFEQPTPWVDLAPDERCDLGMWREGCGIRTWYDGQDQRITAGMDLRVHLPPDFLASIIVTTEDNDHDDRYPNRGNVCLWDVPAGATVNLERGQALVKLADDVQATPTCPQQAIAACDAAGWSADCPCLAAGHAPSSIAIEGRTSDIAVSVPSTTWANVYAENGAGILPTGDYCIASLDVPGAALEPSDFPWKQSGVIAPRESITGAMTIRAFSKECGPVARVESPDLFSRQGEPPLDERRGDITICEGCIQNPSCDDFLQHGLRLSDER